jgi:predicted O-methyltransferase YrrM
MEGIERGKGEANFSDRIFSRAVTFIQDIVVPVQEKRKRWRRKFRELRPPSEEFTRRLEELGLDPKRLYWGPMTIMPSQAEFLVSQIEMQPPRRVLEVGSGTTTLVFAALAYKYGFSMLSLENHPRTVELVRKALQDLGLAKHVTIQRCDFVKRRYAAGDTYRWYDADLGRAGGAFDFVFIDGPIETPVGRNGALPEIKPYLASEHRIYMDDIKRPHEQKCILEWRKHFPDMHLEKMNWMGLITLGSIKAEGSGVSINRLNR